MIETRQSLLGILLVVLLVGMPGGRAQEETDLGAVARKKAEELDQAREAYDNADFSRAVSLLTRLMEKTGTATPGSLPVEEEQLLVEALRLRGISYYNLGRIDAAREDFSRLLLLAPDYHLETQLLSPKIVEAFRKVQNQVTGLLVVKSDPPGADVLLGREILGATPLDAHRLAAGRYILSVEKRGFSTSRDSIEIKAGQTLTRQVTLERNARDAVLITLPAGGTVQVDEKLVGETSGHLPPSFETSLLDRGLDPAMASAPFTLPYLSPGRHVLTVSKDCYTTAEATFEVVLDDSPLPLELEPVVLRRSVVHARFQSNPSGAEVRIDGIRRGATPLELPELCAGTVEVEMVLEGVGRWHGSVDLEPGRSVLVRHDLKLTLASLGAVRQAAAGHDSDAWNRFVDRLVMAQTAYNPLVNGQPDGEPGPGRLELYQRIQSDPSGAPPLVPSSVEALVSETPADLYLVAVPHPDGGGHLLLFGRYARAADRLALSAPTPEILHEIAARLSRRIPITSAWSGLISVDTADSDFPYVLSIPGGVSSGTTVKVGDRMEAVAGRPVTSRLEMEKEFAGRKPGETVEVSVIRKNEHLGAAVVVAETPLLPAVGDRSILLNKYLADLAAARAAGGGRSGSEIISLAIGLAYLMAGEPEKALRLELDRVHLPDRPGVGPGTVAYLRGLCLERLGRSREVEMTSAFARAAEAKGATLWRDDGPFVAPLAAARGKSRP
ncbi:MAG: PEGA domain-containing protein [Acidobacteriota bacterium]